MKPRSAPVIGLVLLSLGGGCSPPTSTTEAVRTVVVPVHGPTAKAPTAKGQPEGEKIHHPPTVAAMNPRITPLREAADAGIIRGRVLWNGPVPTPPAAQTLSWGERKLSVVPTPPLQVDARSRGVANTAVWVEGQTSSQPPEGGARLAQNEGQYRPHLSFARRGQKLQVRTSDPRADFQATGAATFSDTLSGGQTRQHTLSTLGLIEVRSQQAPWMTPAYIHVVEHGFHAISGADGSFQLPPLKPGEYNVMLWHEGWKSATSAPVSLRVAVKLGKDEGAAIEWTLPEK